MHQGLGCASSHPLAHERMHDRVQTLPGVRVVEDELAQAGAVDPAVADVIGTEFALDEIKSQTFWRVYGVSRLVRIDHRRAQLAKHLCHGRLARPGAARQPNELQFGWMADGEKFGAVVVGAGPAGTASAITMAKAGLQVALLERGAKPGSKNVMGGILYNHYLEEIVGEEWKQAPLERPIIEERRWMMTPDAAISFDYKNIRNRTHPHSYSVLRARFDPWFAEQAEKAGAMVVPETVVERLIVKNGRVIGVATGRGDDVYADVTIVCEGIGLGTGLLESTVINGKPLRRKLRPNEIAMAVKDIRHLVPEGGYRGIPKVYGPGYLVCGDAAMLSNPVHREGSNLAMESGRLAGETVIHCKELGDFSERRLAEYRGRLDHSWIMADMKKYDQPVALLEHNPQMLTKYPQVLDRALDEFFRVDGTSKWDKQKNILKMLRKEGLVRMGWDTFKALWAMK